MKCDSSNEWTQQWPGFALNMRAVRDSCQPSATLGGNQRLNGFKSLSWHKSCTSSYKCFYTGLWMSPHSSFSSVLFRHIVILRRKGNARQQRTEHLCTTVIPCQPDSDMNGLKLSFNRFFFAHTLVHLYLCDYSYCTYPLNMQIYAEMKQDREDQLQVQMKEEKLKTVNFPARFYLIHCQHFQSVRLSSLPTHQDL